MAQIEVGLGAVVGDIDFAVLIRTHRPRIDVQIGIELANPDLVPARLEERPEGRRKETFTERRDHAAGDENEPRHGAFALGIQGPVAQAPRREKLVEEQRAYWASGTGESEFCCGSAAGAVAGAAGVVPVIGAFGLVIGSALLASDVSIFGVSRVAPA